VMHRARIAQIGTPRELYESPANAFVADFLGDSNLIAGTIAQAQPSGFAVKIGNGAVIHAASAPSGAAIGDRIFVLIRPEDMAVHPANAGDSDGADRLVGTVTELSYHGDAFKLDVAVGSDILRIKVGRGQGGAFEIGRRVLLTWTANAARLLPAASDASQSAGRAS